MLCTGLAAGSSRGRVSEISEAPWFGEGIPHLLHLCAALQRCQPRSQEERMLHVTRPRLGVCGNALLGRSKRIDAYCVRAGRRRLSTTAAEPSKPAAGSSASASADEPGWPLKVCACCACLLPKVTVVCCCLGKAFLSAVNPAERFTLHCIRMRRALVRRAVELFLRILS